MLLATTQQAAPARATGLYTMREARSIGEQEWDGLLQNSPGGGHWLQTYAWGELKRTLGWKPVRLVLERDGEPAGVAQFLVYSTPFVPGTLMYSPKGPWIPWEDPEAVRVFFKGLRTVAQRERAHTVKIEPEVVEQQAKVKNQLTDIGFHKFRWDMHYKTTMVMDLSPPPDELLAQMKEKTRYNIRLAGRKGVVVEEDSSPEALEQIWDMTQVTADRHGFTLRRPKEYLLPSWQLFIDKGRGHIFFATHEGDRLSSMLVYTLGNKYWYHNGASIELKRNLMAPYKVQWEVMLWAKEHGHTYYDMVAIPNPDELEDESHPMHGLYRFKSGFGAEIREFVGCLDWYIKPMRAKAWNRLEPAYYRIYQKITGDVYY